MQPVSIAPSELKAEKGKFRAVVFIDSEPYRLGEDTVHLNEALARAVHAKSSPFQVYNDQGETQIEN